MAHMMLPTSSKEEIAEARCAPTHARTRAPEPHLHLVKAYTLNELNHGREQGLQL